jgi:hypothetical protein
MVGTRSQKTLSAIVAVVLLSLAVVSRAPQSKCRCHERRKLSSQSASSQPASSRPVKQEQKPCVFGQLRTLTASYLLPAAVEPQSREPVASVLVTSNSLVGLAHHVGVNARPRARSPPFTIQFLS